MLRALRIIARIAFVGIVVGTIGVGAFIAITLAHFSRDLPDLQQIANYVPATGSKVYAANGTLMSQFELEHRIPVQLANVPKLVIQAFLAAEDRDFYSHNGVNPGAIFRAGLADVMRMHRGQRPMGASTITQQVVRHFLLTNEVSVGRKIKEALLAYRIEKALSKDRILEIYLNEIYLGAGAYGVAAAADTYFQKPLDQLSLSEIAFLATLPKAPNNYNPFRHPEAAKARRDWVLAGMAEIGAVTQVQAKSASAEPIGAHLRNDLVGGPTGYFAEEVRRELIGRFGEKAVYEGGLTARTSFDPNYQQMSEVAFRNGLVAYDRRHGWRGPVNHQPTPAAAEAALLTMAPPAGIAPWQLAAVTEVDAGGASIAVKGGGTGRISVEELRWARRTIADQQLGAYVRQPRDVVEPGDIILVEAMSNNVGPASAGRGRRAIPVAATSAVPAYGLRQIPDVSGGIVVSDPQTGRVYAMVGGWSFQQSQFNRATQAQRQPGSAFKPFVYVTAMQNGFTPSSVVDDAPISIPQGPGLPPWSPGNYEGDYVGPTTLDDALTHSRNLVTARLATMIGLPPIAQTVEAFDVMDHMPLYYSMTLGAGDTTLLRMTNAYAMLDNGGHWLLPSVIDTVQDRDGHVIYQKGVNGCAACYVAAGQRNAADNSALYHAGGAPSGATQVAGASYADNPIVYKPTKPDPLVEPTADAEIISMMQDVVQKGTGTEVAKVGKPIAGKTGTTSDFFDAWFVGFTPDLAAGVYVGFDDPRTLGNGEVGGRVAAPIFRDFMMAALKDKPAKPFAPPEGAEVDAATTSNANSGRTKLAKLNPDDDPANLPGDGSTTGAMSIPGGGSNASPNGDYSYNLANTPDNTVSVNNVPDAGRARRNGRGYPSTQPDDAAAWSPGYAVPPTYAPAPQNAYAPNPQTQTYAATPPASYGVPGYTNPGYYGTPTYGAQTYGSQTYGSQTYGSQTYGSAGYGSSGYGGSTGYRSYGYAPAPTTYGAPYGAPGYGRGYAAPAGSVRPLAGTGGLY